MVVYRLLIHLIRQRDLLRGRADHVRGPRVGEEEGIPRQVLIPGSAIFVLLVIFRTGTEFMSDYMPSHDQG